MSGSRCGDSYSKPYLPYIKERMSIMADFITSLTGRLKARKQELIPKRDAFLANFRSHFQEELSNNLLDGLDDPRITYLFVQILSVDLNEIENKMGFQATASTSIEGRQTGGFHFAMEFPVSDLCVNGFGTIRLGFGENSEKTKRLWNEDKVHVGQFTYSLAELCGLQTFFFDFQL
jgi:hypothetical protein